MEIANIQPNFYSYIVSTITIIPRMANGMKANLKP